MNQQVGNLVGIFAHNFPLVVLNDGGTLFVVRVSATRLSGGVPDIYFDAADCTGTPYMQASSANMNGLSGPLPAIAVADSAGGGFDVYMPDGAPSTVKTMSRLSTDEGTCYADGPSGTNRSVNKVLPPIHLEFSAPFTVQ